MVHGIRIRVPVRTDGGGDRGQLLGGGSVPEHVTARHQGEFSRREQSVPDDELVRRPGPGCGRGPVDVDAGPAGRDHHDVALAGRDEGGGVQEGRDPQRAGSSGAGAEAELHDDVCTGRTDDAVDLVRRDSGVGEPRPVRRPARSRTSRGREGVAPAPCCGHRRWRHRETGVRAREGRALDFSTVRP